MDKKSKCRFKGNQDGEIYINDLLLVAKWIAASLTGELTDDEYNLLEKWRLQSEEHQQLYERMQNMERQKLTREKFASFNKLAGWDGFREKQKKDRRKSLRIRIMNYAAIVLLVGGVFYFFAGNESKKLSDREPVSVMPGKPQAQLVMADGKLIDLVEQTGVIKGENVLIHNTRKQISYEDVVHLEEERVVYNEVRVPRGGEYQVKLSDGTLVYLNSLTRLRFPVLFSGQTRVVELEGEAYFEVAKDVEKPFIVKTGTYDVQVLGTHFNISTYEEESTVETTLVEGAVAISGEGIEGKIVLKPDEQFVFDRESGKCGVKSVDVSYFVAWKDGKFRFRDVRLEDIMRAVERWYNVQVVYEDESVKNLRFGFNMSRHETIEPLLNIFELNGKVKINKEGTVLKIRQGR